MTTVLEHDTPQDRVHNTNSKVSLVGDVIDEDRQKDIDEWEREFSDTLTEEPGLTRLVEFAIETENSIPIAQRPYNTPVMLREGE